MIQQTKQVYHVDSGDGRAKCGAIIGHVCDRPVMADCPACLGNVRAGGKAVLIDAQGARVTKGDVPLGTVIYIDKGDVDFRSMWIAFGRLGAQVFVREGYAPSEEQMRDGIKLAIVAAGE